MRSNWEAHKAIQNWRGLIKLQLSFEETRWILAYGKNTNQIISGILHRENQTVVKMGLVKIFGQQCQLLILLVILCRAKFPEISYRLMDISF